MVGKATLTTTASNVMTKNPNSAAANADRALLRVDRANSACILNMPVNAPMQR